MNNNGLPFVDENKNACRLSFKIKNIPKSRLIMKIMHEKMDVKTRGYYLHTNVITYNECGIEYDPCDHKVVFIEAAQRHCKSAFCSAAQVVSERATEIISRLYPEIEVDLSNVSASQSKATSPVPGVYTDVKIFYLD